MKFIANPVLLTRVYTWVFQTFFTTLHSRVTNGDVSKPLLTVERWLRTRGPVWTADAVKTHRLALTRYLAGTPLTSPSGVSLTKDGLPRLLPAALRDLIRERDLQAIRLSLTLLSVTRVLLGGKPVDLKAIETPSSPLTDEVEREIPAFLSHFEIEPIQTDWTQYHWSTKAGPNGPALRTALYDWSLLSEDLKNDLQILAGEDFKFVRKTFDKLNPQFFNSVSQIFWKNPKRALIRKLSVKPDRETKSRVFALLDYYSQTVLNPLSRGLFKALKQIPSDRTFVQAGEGLSQLRPSSSYHSVDLSNATDRFPASLQVTLLKHLIGEQKAQAWSRIMVGHEFDLNGRKVTYATGQPMGAYSSWPLFTMAHHLVVWTAARAAGKPAGFSNYAILGDDIVIADDQVAREYKRILRDLEVPISEAKTHTSPDVYEFAKRWFFKGTEVSPFPVHALVETHNKYHLLYNSFKLAFERGYGQDAVFSLRNPVKLLEFLRAFDLPSRLIKSVMWKFALVANLPEGNDDAYTAFKKVQTFHELCGTAVRCSIRCETALRRFAASAADILSKLASKEAQTAIDDINRYSEVAVKVLEDGLPRSADQAELLDNQSYIPVIGALGDLSYQTTQSINELEDTLFAEVSTGEVWESPKRIRILSLPRLEGVNPLRSSHRIAGARATLATRLARDLKARERGLEANG